MMHGLAPARLPPVLHLLHLAHRASRSSTEYLAELLARAPPTMRPNFFVNTPDILHAYLQYGGPPAFKIRAVLAATMSPDLGRVRGLRALRARRVRAGQRGVPRLGEVPAAARATGRRAEREGRTLAPYLTRLNEIRRAHPALQQLRNLHVPPHRQRPGASPTRKTRPSTTGDTVLVVVNLDPHHTRRPRSHWTCRASAWTGTTRSSVHDEITGETYHWGRAQLRAARPGRTSPPTSSPSCDASPADRSVTHTDDRHTSPCRDTVRATPPAKDRDPDWFKRAVFYEVLVRGVPRLQRRRHRRPRGPDREARLPAVARRRLPLAAAVLRLAAARRRLRHRRLHDGPAGVRHRRRLRRARSTRRTSAASG